jgi:hypothetical protein
MSAEECDVVIERANEGGFDTATLSTPAGTAFRLEYRNNDRHTFTDQELADELWDRLWEDDRLHNPGWTAIGLNERFRVYRYEGDQYFASHFDGQFERVPGEELSWVTLLVYLNDDFEGGQTIFQDGEVVPEKGKAALMTQTNYLHEAVEAKGGVKYVLRSDVMYRRQHE